jgi:glycosyltransferase involved in cell wall biosynthesis
VAVHVALADPPAFTPQYDHELAAALARAGAEVDLLTSRFRFGAIPAADGYRRVEAFYPVSSRLFRRSRLRLPVRAAEHVAVQRRLTRVAADVLHLQWLAWPKLDRRLRFRVPTVFTAHDLVPRRTSAPVWRELLPRFDRVVVHSERGRETVVELGATAEGVRVIPHPVFPSDPPRADDGRTALCLGLIRPYKGIADAVEAVNRVDGARLLVAGEPVEPVDAYRAAAGDRAEWRLGYLPDEDLDRALSEATVALFPYRAELDQSGAMLRALGAGVPAIVYDVGGLGDPIRAFGAGRVVAPGDVDGLAAALRGLLDDPAALAEARAGAERARAALTWDAAAAAHLALYGELA